MKNIIKFERHCPHCGELITKEQLRMAEANYQRKVHILWKALAERNAEICMERKSGKTVKELASKYGISVSRIRQIIEWGYP
jgi:DNA-directed RNA polymerase sigma subunit (sigma70/sigma32)